MADVTLTNLLGTNPVTTALTGDEPLETVVSSVSEAATIKQLSFAALSDESSTSYTLTVDDQGKVRTMSSSSANVVTIPTNAAVAFPIGGSMVMRQIGTGTTSFEAASGVVLQYKSSASLSMSERYGQAVLHKVAEDTWHICGELEAL